MTIRSSQAITLLAIAVAVICLALAVAYAPACRPPVGVAGFKIFGC